MVIGKFVRIFQAPLCKGSSAEGGEGLFLQPSNRCAVSEPLSARPASVLRTLANPLCKGSSAEGGEGLFLQPFHHFVVPLPLHRGGKVRTPLGDACKHAPHTCKSLYTKEPKTRHHFNLLAPQAHRFSSFFYLRFYLRVADVALAKRQKFS